MNQIRAVMHRAQCAIAAYLVGGSERLGKRRLDIRFFLPPAATYHQPAGILFPNGFKTLSHKVESFLPGDFFPAGVDVETFFRICPHQGIFHPVWIVQIHDGRIAPWAQAAVIGGNAGTPFDFDDNSVLDKHLCQTIPLHAHPANAFQDLGFPGCMRIRFAAVVSCVGKRFFFFRH